MNLLDLLQRAPLALLVTGSVLALLTLGFLLFFLGPAVRLRLRLGSVHKQLRSAKARSASDLQKIFQRDPRLLHLWNEFRDTLHAQREERDGQMVTVALRATAPAEAFFNSQYVVDGRLRTEFFKHLPGIFTGIGIIGTFLGLIVGLRDFVVPDDPAKVRQSLELLLGGVFEAFIVSAAAITLAMVVTFLEKVLLASLYRCTEDIAQHLDSLFAMGAGEEYLSRLVTASEDAAAQSKILKDSLVGDLKVLLQEMTERQIAAHTANSETLAKEITAGLASSLQEPLNRIGEVVAKASGDQSATAATLLQDVMASFSQRLNDLFGGQITGLQELNQRSAQAMQEAVTALHSLLGRMEENSQRSGEAMAEKMAGSNRAYASFLMTSNVTAMSAWCRIDPEELLLGHTVFPYTVAFMPKATRTALLSKALLPHQGEDSFSSLTKNVSHGLPYRRLCPLCLKEDLAQLGEAYWRRSHMLPAALMCSTHGVPLQVSEIPVRGETQTRNMLLPHEVLSWSLPCHVRPETQAALTTLSVQLLHRPVSASEPEQEAPYAAYRAKALGLGFVLPSGAVASVPLAANLASHFGERLLADAGCEVATLQRNSWPTLMVRPGVGMSFATAKHVLLQTFLSEASPSSVTVTGHYGRPGKKTQDYTRLDSRSAARLKAIIARATSRRERYTVQAMLSELGIWSSFRHKRELFPKTNALVKAFRSSNQSERQLGRRQHWRQRGTKRAQLRALNEVLPTASQPSCAESGLQWT